MIHVLPTTPFVPGVGYRLANEITAKFSRLVELAAKRGRLVIISLATDSDSQESLIITPDGSSFYFDASFTGELDMGKYLRPAPAIWWEFARENYFWLLRDDSQFPLFGFAGRPKAGRALARSKKAKSELQLVTLSELVAIANNQAEELLTEPD